jgi:hypothetical protein
MSSKLVEFIQLSKVFVELAVTMESHLREETVWHIAVAGRRGYVVSCHSFLSYWNLLD